MKIIAKIITEDRITALLSWIETHKKAIVIAMLIAVFINLVYSSASVLRYKEKPLIPIVEGIDKLKQTQEKVGDATKIRYNQAANVQALYQQAQAIMKKDSLTIEDKIQLQMIDSTMRHLLKR
jgi:type IV secretory pathway TrbF-like protein